jgi:phosphopantothenoylcysteine decarboxylase/phosphopantothenate--cysteine ligase
VGFAAETTEVAAHAADKLTRKGADLVVANDVSAPHTGFEHDTNAVLILSASGSRTDVPLSDKRAVARAVLDAVVAERSNPTPQRAPSDNPSTRSST